MENTKYYLHTRKHCGNLQIEVGDAKQPLFHPQVKIKAWDNEANFSMRYIGMAAGRPVTEGGKVKLKTDGQEAHFYHKNIDLKTEHLAHRSSIDYAHPVEHLTDGFEHFKIGNVIIGRDSNEERTIRQAAATAATGDVLMVGLGLGVMLEYLQHAKTVTVVEISQQVVDHVKQLYPERLANVRVIVDDFYNYASTTTDKFDYIYGDIFPALLPGHTLDWWQFKQTASNLLRPGGKITGRIEEYAEDFEEQTIGDVGHEFEIILASKPASNIFSFSVHEKNVEFIYQPDLDQERLLEGAFRPASVIGSYAIYHKSKMHNQYGTGKIAHIYRPKIHDSAGNWVFGNLNYHDNMMDVTVPQDFLNGATYPVVVDPTFGYTSVGASNSGSNGSDTLRGAQYTGLAFNPTSISVYYVAKTSGIGGKAGIYTRSGSVLTLVSNSGTTADTAAYTNAWATFTFSVAPSVSAISYDVISYVQGAAKGSNNSMAFDTGSANQGSITSTGTYPTLPSSYTGTFNTDKFSIYVTGGSPLIDGISAAAGHDTAQFTDITNGADTDPFASTDQVGFTVPGGEALTNSTTYFWRVRASDPLGTNNFGAWSSTRSFTTTAAAAAVLPIRVMRQAVKQSNEW